MANPPKQKFLAPHTILGQKFHIVRKIGSGSYGEVYLALNGNGDEVAVKVEGLETEHPQLQNESKLYRQLVGGAGIPRVLYYGTEKNCRALVMNYLGPSLADLFEFCNKKFTLKTVLMLFDQMIQRISYIHSKSIIHRDIKPENFLMGKGHDQRIVFLVDFGLAKKYRDTSTLAHIPCREGKSLTGKVRYASINTHLGVEQSRRDDMESLGYVILYFLRGSLPWQNVNAATKAEKYEKICEKKLSTPIKELCRGQPKEFVTYFILCRILQFEEEPSYLRLRNLFKELFKRLTFTYDYKFDWIMLQLKYKFAPPTHAHQLNRDDKFENEVSVLTSEDKLNGNNGKGNDNKLTINEFGTGNVQTGDKSAEKELENGDIETKSGKVAENTVNANKVGSGAFCLEERRFVKSTMFLKDSVTPRRTYDNSRNSAPPSKKPTIERKS